MILHRHIDLCLYIMCAKFHWIVLNHKFFTNFLVDLGWRESTLTTNEPNYIYKKKL